VDLYYINDDANGEAISFAEWRTTQTTTTSQNKLQLVNAMKEHTWRFPEAEESNLEEIMKSANGIIYRLPKPDDINESLNLIVDWFLEECGDSNSSEQDSTASSNTVSPPPTYTLSPLAHGVVAKDLQSLLEEADALVPKRDATVLSSSTSSSGSGSSDGSGENRNHNNEIPLGTWGSGDSCQLWFETGKGVPRHHSRGLRYKEISSSSFLRYYALEVSAAFGSLAVRNPFEEDRMLYLSYLTTSANASSKKVYPRTKVQIQPQYVLEEGGTSALSSKRHVYHQELQHFIVLDPSHDDNLDVTHRTRTTAVGLIPAGSTVQLEFQPLEEYTLHPFRIVGLSFLAKEKVSYKIPSEFSMGQHGLAVDSNDDGLDDNLDDQVGRSSYGDSLFGWIRGRGGDR
jgi:hypothetical protein